MNNFGLFFIQGNNQMNLLTDSTVSPLHMFMCKLRLLHAHSKHDLLSQYLSRQFVAGY